MWRMQGTISRRRALHIRTNSKQISPPMLLTCTLCVQISIARSIEQVTDKCVAMHVMYFNAHPSSGESY
jgi:hypothetical protein